MKQKVLLCKGVLVLVCALFLSTVKTYCSFGIGANIGGVGVGVGTPGYVAAPGYYDGPYGYGYNRPVVVQQPVVYSDDVVYTDQPVVRGRTVNRPLPRYRD